MNSRGRIFASINYQLPTGFLLILEPSRGRITVRCTHRDPPRVSRPEIACHLKTIQDGN
jgi:hypothetical protein